MRLLYTLTSYVPAVGGAQQHHHAIAQQMAARHDVQVVCQWSRNRSDWLLGTTLRAPSRAQDYVVDGVPVRRLGVGWREKIALAPAVVLYYPLMPLALPRVAKGLEARLAPFADGASLVHNVRIGREALTYASRSLARKRGVPLVLTTPHDPRWVGLRYRSFLDLYRTADAVIALTEAEARVLEGLGVARARITVTGIGPLLAPSSDAAAFRRAFGIDASAPVVLFLGQHYAYKGFAALLAAAKHVHARFPETHFVFLGPAVGDSERHFAGIDARIHRLGVQSLQTKTDALAACAVLAVPSTQESFGGVYTEAWSSGKPVVACPIPAVRELVEDGVDGLLVPQESRAVADAVASLLADEGRAAAMGRAGRAKVAARFTWPALAARTEAAYRRALGGSRASTASIE